VPRRGQCIDDHYILDKLITYGGMSEVWLGHDINDRDRKVVIKVLRSPLIDDPDFKKRFEEETQIALQLSHAKLARMYNAIEKDGLYYIVTEYFAGKSLKDYLALGKPLPPELAADVAAQIASGLQAAHVKRLVHRDVRPDNVLIPNRGIFILANFGIGIKAFDYHLIPRREAMDLLPYWSPEQAEGKVMDPRSDVYSLGVLLYEMLTGKLPFENQDEEGLCLKIVHTPPVPPSTIKPDIPQELNNLVLHALTKDPDQRLAKAAQFETELRDYLTTARPPVWGPIGVSPIRLMSRLVGLVCLLGSLSLLIYALNALNERDPALPPPVVIEIGVMLPLNGTAAEASEPIKNGVQLAIEQANSRPGVTLDDGTTYSFEMRVLDHAVNGKHDLKKAEEDAKTLVSRSDVMAVVGPYNSSVAKAILPIFNTAGLPIISPSNSLVDLTKLEFAKQYRPTGSLTYFRLSATDDLQGWMAAEYMYDTLNFRSIHILDDGEPYGIGLADAVEARFTGKGGQAEHYGSVLDISTYLGVTSQMPHPDALFYGATFPTGLQTARKQMLDSGRNIPLFGGDGMKESQFFTSTINAVIAFQNHTGEVVSDSYATVPAADAANLPEAKQFLVDYRNRFKSEPLGAYSANGFAATNIIIDAIKHAGKKDRDAVRKAIDENSFQGILGDIHFDANGDVSKKWIAVYKAEYKGQSGEWVFQTQRYYELREPGSRLLVIGLLICICLIGVLIFTLVRRRRPVRSSKKSRMRP
jgi:ABC-type branched-subunit amino acid transport system substrate-binding protein/tRNA A-37 threonylcarbamoyl transferase component Bud32